MKGDLYDDVVDVVNTESKKMRKISKTDFIENMHMIMGQLGNLIATIGDIQGSDRVKFVQTITDKAADVSNFFCATCAEVSKAIKDRKGGLDAFAVTAQNILTVLQMVERNVNVIFSEKFTTIYNTRLSQLAVFFMVDRAQIFANFSVYLYDGMLYDIVVNEGEHELDQPRPYRYQYIREYKDTVIEIMKAGSTSNGANALISEIDRLRKDYDTPLINDNNQVPKDFMPKSRGFGLIEGGVSILAMVFRYFGEWGVMLRNLKYQKMLQEREWLQNHTDLLKLQLNGADPNSEEYRKAVKIINTYNEMIKELDLKINSYMAD